MAKDAIAALGRLPSLRDLNARHRIGVAWIGTTAAAAAGSLLLVLGCGILYGLRVLPKGPWFYPGIALHWDGGWYDNIARLGYVWNPMLGREIGHYQNVAFFPLYALIERGITLLTGSRAPWLMVLPGLLAGLASIPLFLRLAQRLLPPRDATLATLLYALYPAAAFLVMGYPTGVMNLLAILALLDIIEGRRWRAALWCGIGTAGGPLAAFIAWALCLDQGIAWLRGGMPMRAIPGLIGFGLLTVSGLLAFILYQGAILGDPLAFIHSQAAWGVAPVLGLRLHRMISPDWYFNDMLAYTEGSYAALTSLHITISDGYMIQIAMGKLFVLLAAIGVLASFRLRPLAVPLSGLAILIGYLWFIDTIQNATSATRLLFLALPMFLGWAILIRRAPLALRAGAVLLCAALLVLQTGLAIAGYWVV